MESTLSTPPSSGPDAQDDLRKKRRTVRFVEDNTQTENSPAASDQASEAVDLRSVENVCTVLAHKNTMCRGPQCPVYLDGVANETFRHTFLESPAAVVSSSSSIKMSEILNQPVETSVNFVDQLKLARDFVMTVLKFHSTPWLREHYTLHDLSFFRSNDGDVASCLQTAHLGLDFIQSSPDADCSTQMADACNDEAIETARLTHGVRNLTLWSLGAVLLQIGTWSTIEHLDDVAKIRRLAQRVPMLGKRYRDLTKQCLECDFAFGDDLSKPRLQQAVYENVVCGLSDMIRSLDIGDE